MSVRLVQESKMTLAEMQVLRTRLDNFYESVTDYLAFATASNQTGCWNYIGSEISEQVEKGANQQPIKILEVGAGRSGFGHWLKQMNLRKDVHWTAQDVTVANAEWLNGEADSTVYGDINKIPPRSKFDIIFSTYVLEHVTDPEQHLNLLHSLLSEEGKMFIFCPRYDVPGYLCPSSKHLSMGRRLLIAIQVVAKRIHSFFIRRPAFLIQTDLAAFYQPFFIDADAVHWVSLLDLKLWAKRKKSRFKTLYTNAGKPGSKDWIVKRFMTCAVEIQKYQQVDNRSVLS